MRFVPVEEFFISCKWKGYLLFTEEAFCSSGDPKPLVFHIYFRPSVGRRGGDRTASFMFSSHMSCLPAGFERLDLPDRITLCQHLRLRTYRRWCLKWSCFVGTGSMKGPSAALVLEELEDLGVGNLEKG